jgi:hypothetical protein
MERAMTRAKLAAVVEAINTLNLAERRKLVWYLADEFTLELDREGWMIVPNPTHEDGVPEGPWWLGTPSNDCPTWCDNGMGFDVFDSPRARRGRLQQRKQRGIE